LCICKGTQRSKRPLAFPAKAQSGFAWKIRQNKEESGSAKTGTALLFLENSFLFRGFSFAVGQAPIDKVSDSAESSRAQQQCRQNIIVKHTSDESQQDQEYQTGETIVHPAAGIIYLMVDNLFFHSPIMFLRFFGHAYYAFSRTRSNILILAKMLGMRNRTRKSLTRHDRDNSGENCLSLLLWQKRTDLPRNFLSERRYFRRRFCGHAFLFLFFWFRIQLKSPVFQWLAKETFLHPSKPCKH